MRRSSPSSTATTSRALRFRAAAALLPALTALTGCGGDPAALERVAVTLYASGPPAAERPAIEAVRRTLAARGGMAGRFRVTLSWTGVPRDADRGAALAAARRAVEDPRAIAYIDAGTGPDPLAVVAFLNLAGVPVANVDDPGLARALCGPDPYPSGVRTGAAPSGEDAGARAAAATDAVLDALAPLPPEFTREPVTRALQQRFARC